MSDSFKNTNLVPEPVSICFGVKLNGNNYFLQSQVVETFVVSRGKLGYLRGTIKESFTSDATYEKWSIDKAIVKSRLVGAMEPDIMSLFVRLPTAKSIWDTVSQTYYEGSDRSVIYDLSCQAMRMKQERKSVFPQFADLRKILQELDHRKPISFTQADVIHARQKEIEVERVYIFLAGLDDIYDRVQSDILRTSPFPNPEFAFAMV